MRKRLQAFFWLLAALAALMTAILLVTQYLLQRDSLHLREHFLPRWQVGQQLNTDTQRLNAQAARLPLALTLGELESTRDRVDSQFRLIEASLARIIQDTGDDRLGVALGEAILDLRESVDQAEATARERIALSRADQPSPGQLQALDMLRRREGDLARLLDHQAASLSSYAGGLTAGVDRQLRRLRDEYTGRLWLQTLLIALAGLTGVALLWTQYRLLDRHLLQRIDALRQAMASGGIDARLLENSGHVDELGTMQAELARLLERLKRQNDALEQLAITDELTGLANRRHLFAQLDQEIQRSRRYTKPLSVILIDIDHFKHINDTWGHSVGDQVLREAARVFRASSRGTDLAARYGGEEFALLLPETALEGALTRAEGLRLSIAETDTSLPDGTTVRVTISLGVATLRAGEAAEALMRRADAALYVAKQSGRNRVEAEGMD